MERPPFIPPPGLLRAIPGFIIGFLLGIVIVTLTRLLMGMIGIGDVTGVFDGEMERLFVRDEALFMFALLFGAFGFVWGAGGLIGTPIGPDPHSHALVPVKPKKSRIPSDPDAPVNPNNPVRQLFGAIPNTVLIIGAVAVLVVLMALIPFLGIGTPQVYSDTASSGSFGEGSFNLLGLVTIEANQAVMFFGFAVIVILLVLGAPLSLALLLYLLNREVKQAEAAPPNPEAGQDFILIRLAGFFNQWLLDAVSEIGGARRPR